MPIGPCFLFFFLIVFFFFLFYFLDLVLFRTSRCQDGHSDFSRSVSFQTLPGAGASGFAGGAAAPAGGAAGFAAPGGAAYWARNPRVRWRMRFDTYAHFHDSPLWFWSPSQIPGSPFSPVSPLSPLGPLSFYLKFLPVPHDWILICMAWLVCFL